MDVSWSGFSRGPNDGSYDRLQGVIPRVTLFHLRAPNGREGRPHRLRDLSISPFSTVLPATPGTTPHCLQNQGSYPPRLYYSSATGNQFLVRQTRKACGARLAIALDWQALCSDTAGAVCVQPPVPYAPAQAYCPGFEPFVYSSRSDVCFKALNTVTLARIGCPVKGLLLKTLSYADAEAACAAESAYLPSFHNGGHHNAFARYRYHFKPCHNLHPLGTVVEGGTCGTKGTARS